MTTYSVSGSFGANGAGATVSVCGSSVTADASGYFSRTGIAYGTACNNVSATRTGYSCSVTTNGPSSLTANFATVAGSCTVLSMPVSGWTYVGTSLYGTSVDYGTRVGYSYSIADPVACSTLCGSSPKAFCYSSNDQFCQCYNTWNTKSDRSGSAVACYTNNAYPKYTVSGSFGASAAGAKIFACGYTTTADSSGNFSLSNVAGGTACNNVSGVLNGYVCTASVNWPSSLSSNISNISGSCATPQASCTYDVIKVWSYTPPSSITINNACWPIVLDFTFYDPGSVSIINNSGKAISKINYMSAVGNAVTFNVTPTNGVVNTGVNIYSTCNTWTSYNPSGVCDANLTSAFTSFNFNTPGTRAWTWTYSSAVTIN